MKRLATVTILVGLVISIQSVVAAQTAAAWEAEMQLKLKLVGTPRVSPDGKRVVYTISEAVTTSDRSEFVTQLWLASVDTKQNIQITFNEKSSAIPNGRRMETG